MAHNEMRPPALETRNGLGIDKASTASVPKYSAAPGRRQLRVPVRSILSIDSRIVYNVHGSVASTAAWLASALNQSDDSRRVWDVRVWGSCPRPCPLC